MGRVTILGACAILGALALGGCSTALLRTSIPTTPEALDEVRRGGQAWGCHERTSEVFRLYLVCPRQETVLGVADSNGRLGFACPDLRIKKCRRFVADIRHAGRAANASSETAP